MLRIGMKFPGKFAAIYAMSPCCLAPNLAPNPFFQSLAEAVEDDEQFANAPAVVKAILAAAAAWSPNPLRQPFYLDLPIESSVQRPEIVGMWAANAPLAMLPQ